MSLKKSIQWDQASDSFIGYVNFGFEENSTDEASNAYVIMAVGITGHWKIPLGYFLTAGMSASRVASLVKEALIRLHNVGIKAISVTFDGARYQISAMELLGASFASFSTRPYFPHPCDSSISVMTVLDPSHMLKLVRNALHAYKSFHWDEHGEIRWAYFEKLQELQTLHHLRGGNKLTLQHIDFENKKMKVCLASQLFSKSVADTLRFCHFNGVPEFAADDVLVTADFAEMINDIFDVLKCRSPFGKAHHAPITKTNYQEKKDFLNSVKIMIESLSVREATRSVKLLHSKRKTGFMGLLCNCEVLSKLHETMLLPSQLTSVLFYKFSQDHLESFFGAVRARNGWTVNPTPVQFRAAYRALLFFGSDMRVSLNCNTASQDNTRSLSVRQENAIKSLTKVSTIGEEISSLTCPCNLDDCKFCDATLSYISGFIVMKIMRKSSCDLCKGSLLFTTMDPITGSDLIALKNRGGLV